MPPIEVATEIPILGQKPQVEEIAPFHVQHPANNAHPLVLVLPGLGMNVDEHGNKKMVKCHVLHQFGGFSKRLELVKAFLTGCMSEEMGQLNPAALHNAFEMAQRVLDIEETLELKKAQEELEREQRKQ